MAKRRARGGAVVIALAVASVAALPASAGAANGSILYRKAGKLWVASPDGKTRRAVPRSGGLENPSQDDRGRIVAQRGINLHRIDRRGRRLNRPFTTPFRTTSVLPQFKGPFWPEVSPNGRLVAYTYSHTAARYDPSCDCTVVAPSLNTSYTRSDRFTDVPERSVGLARMYSRASWMDNSRVLMTTESLYDHAGNVLDTIAIDPVGGGADSYQRWFSECTGCESIQTLQLYPLTDGEMTRRRDKMVFVSGPLGSKQTGSQMLMYRLAPGMPPGIPQHFCRVTGPRGRFANPTWAPNGASLAWADARGIWVGRVRNLDGTDCDITRRLVIPGGNSPDWGPARH